MHQLIFVVILLIFSDCCFSKLSFNSINYNSFSNDWVGSDNLSNNFLRRSPSYSMQRLVRRSPYVMINKDVFVYKPSQYSPWSNWTDCSAKDCSQTRYRKCSDNYWNRRSVKRSYRYGCPVKYIMEKRRCSNIPECKLSETSFEPSKTVIEKCGIRPNISVNSQMKLKVTGGKQATPHSWPWQVALVLKAPTRPRYSQADRYICGATLIHPSWVITAAHCLRSLSRYRLRRGELFDPARYGLGNLVIRIGDHSRDNKEEIEIDRKISYIVLHPNFKISSFTNIFDVALLKMATPIQAGPQINFACLPERSTNLPDNTTCIATGWGHTSAEKRLINISPPQGIDLDWMLSSIGSRKRSRSLNEQSYPKSKDFHITFSRMSMNREQPLHLMEVKVPLINFYKCRRSLPEFYIDKRLHVCAGEEGKDTCTGDSGGGLYCKIPGTTNWQLYGITSFGSGIDGCGTRAGIYVKVGAVTNWVRKIIYGYSGDN